MEEFIIVDSIKFTQGMSVSCKLRGRFVKGKISLDGATPPYICQDEFSGLPCEGDRLGYKYSWTIRNGLKHHTVTDLRILNNHEDYEIY